jgi:hypothetical protein
MEEVPWLDMMIGYDDVEDEGYYSHPGGGGNKLMYVLPMVLLGIYFFLFFRDVEFTGNAFLIYESYVVLGIVAIWSQEMLFRHKSPKVVAPGDITTWNPMCAEVAGDYLIIRREGIAAMGFSMKGGGKAGAIIVPLACVNTLGPSAALTAQLVPSPFEALPKEVREKLPLMGFNRESLFLFGLVAPEQYSETLDDKQMAELGISHADLSSLEGIKIRNPSIGHLAATIKDQNKRITFLEGLVNAKVADITKMVDAGSGWKERARGFFLDEPSPSRRD